MKIQLGAAAKRILVVDDSPAQCELLNQALAQHGLEEATQVEQGIASAFSFLEGQSASNHPLPQLILLDLKLSNGSGLDFISRLRSHPRLCLLPVVMLTTSKAPDDIRASYTGGANGYVVKPDSYSELVVVVGDVCRYWLRWNRCGSSADSGEEESP